jgi:DNA primase
MCPGPGPEITIQEFPVPRQSGSTLTAIKQAIDIVALMGEYLPLQRAGSKFKSLCPFHDDHNPSLEINPERQSFKCWSCGAGGDVFDFVQRMDRVEFPEALRMLADRAGIVLEAAERGPLAEEGPSKSDLLSAVAWAEAEFIAALASGPGAEAREYAAGRGLSRASVERFRLGFAPDERGWLQARARRAGIGADVLEAAGLIARHPESGLARDRFRGRLIFPIRDMSGRPIAFGGRALPRVEASWAERGQKIAKYLNSPETLLFQKRRTLYAADLAREAARRSGWVAVVEGYTDVIAAHQAGIENVVGTLGTALGDDHMGLVRRLADRAVLVFDGDEAGQKAVDRALELFLGHALEVRVLTLPDGQDPCDFLLAPGGAEAFRALVDQCRDPLIFAIDRAADRHDLNSPEGTRQAAETVLALLARVPSSPHAGLDLKVAKALDTLGRRLRLPVSDLQRELRQMRRQAGAGAGPGAGPRRSTAPSGPAEPGEASTVSLPVPRPSDLDPIDRELVTLVLNDPALVPALRARVPSDFLREPALRSILQACYDLEAEGIVPAFEQLRLRLDDPSLRSLAAGLLLPIEPSPLALATQPAPAPERLSGLLARLAERSWKRHLADLEAARAELDPADDPDAHRALQREYLKVLSQRPDRRKLPAS